MFQHMESLQQVLIPEIEERLRRKCEHLVVAHDPENSSSGTAYYLVNDEIVELPKSKILTNFFSCSHNIFPFSV